MTDFTVKRYGTDSSGRAIYMTVYMHDWWEHVVDLLGFEPVIVQGAFMVRNGGGAKDSEGAHDQGGSIDVRTRNLATARILDVAEKVQIRDAIAPNNWIEFSD
jgi:hypothetical protein